MLCVCLVSFKNFIKTQLTGQMHMNYSVLLYYELCIMNYWFQHLVYRNSRNVLILTIKRVSHQPIIYTMPIAHISLTPIWFQTTHLLVFCETVVVQRRTTSLSTQWLLTDLVAKQRTARLRKSCRLCVGT